MFRDEDEFQAFFVREFGSVYFGHWIFAKIKRIAGNFIHPEIDLLDIDPIQPTQTLCAFEFKLLNSERMGNNYNRIYAGVGQAFSYFKYGVDQSYLIIGVSNNIQSSQRQRLREIIARLGEIVSELSIDRFQIIMYEAS